MQEPLAPLTVAVVEGTPNVVRLFGELDLATVPMLRAELRTLTGDVELHCDQLTFVDSSGLSLFVDAHQACAAPRRRLRAPRRPSRRAPHHPGQRPRRHLRHPQLARLAAFSRGSPPQLQGSKPAFRQGWRHAGDHLHRGARSDPRRRRGRHAMCRCGDGDAPGPYGPRRRRGRPGDVPERHAVDAHDERSRVRPARPLGSARPGRRERGAPHQAGDLPPFRHGDDQDGQGPPRASTSSSPPAVTCSTRSCSTPRSRPVRITYRPHRLRRRPRQRPAVSPAWSAATPTGRTRPSGAASSSAPTGCIPGSPDRSARPSSTNATGTKRDPVRVLRRSRLVGHRVPPRRRPLRGRLPTHGGEANVWISGRTDTIGSLGRGRAPAREYPRARPACLSRVRPTTRRRARTTPVRGFSGMPNQLRQPVGQRLGAGRRRRVLPRRRHRPRHQRRLPRHGQPGHLARPRAARRSRRAHRARRLPRGRDRDVAELFEITCALANHPPVEEFVELQKRLSRVIEREAQTLAARASATTDRATRSRVAPAGSRSQPQGAPP